MTLGIAAPRRASAEQVSLEHYRDRQFCQLANMILLSGVLDADIVFADGDWCRALCDAVGMDHTAYQKRVIELNFRRRETHQRYNERTRKQHGTDDTL